MKTKLLLFLFLVSLSTYSQNSNLPSNIPVNGLLAYYPFAGNANDVSANQNHGTVNGVTLTTDKPGN